ncbi:prokaryotic type I DNA topoisomerase [Conidiobolus coronatus NRRL 28638]|uniref:DNA topoisomerase n=1 Tax=Conidiobolus coronatus (strain ATCC 28846 / CBS 209.66 / NRRL 28638) TaxID=796925 RepID=A0A137P159_CONC2|nr:prokaryotic type I DNA topoisomerase [Conidiobolus coronatus NRRL 28638]|eukprot:KXN68698.1 prokaryotic type I DNA topoisomerase [Conidiobolus coronatus NRRL 28638]
MRVLCVAEKPSMATELSKILSQGTANRRDGLDQYCANWDFNYQFQNKSCLFTMTSIRGHIMTLDFIAPYNKWLSCQPLFLFETPVQKLVSKEMKNVEKNLLTEARRAQILIIWTDCDREGENIGEEIANICKKANSNIIVYRAKYSVVQPSHIHNACKSPITIDILQAQAVNIRMIIDLRIGASLTRFQTLSLKAAFPELDKDIISYGSCQFPTLGFIVDQYEKAKSFIPENFWYIFFSYTKQENIEFKWKRNKLFDYFTAVILYECCMTEPTAKVILKKEKPTSKWKPLPLTTVELQKAASKILKISSDETMMIAESLYNKGFISYPRTETDQYTPNFEFKPLIEKQLTHPQWGKFANSLISGGKFREPRKGKNNDNSHPPIHPTAQVVNLEGNSKKIYEFITRRFLACCSDDAKGSQTDFEVDIAGEIFTTSGLTIFEKNYLGVYTYEKWNAKTIPNLNYGEIFTPTIFELREGITSAPKLLTEAELISLMDQNQIGTDATIQDHIKKILDRKYAYRENSQQLFMPSKLGIGLVEGYNNIGLERSLTKPLLRRQLEQQLKMVCDGSLQHERVLADSLSMYKEMFIKSFENLPILINELNKFFTLENFQNLQTRYELS